MTQEEMLTALYEKMAAEQDKYRDWLKGQPAAEVLNHAYEYTVREDIVMCMEELELTEAQAKALLASPAPLADVYKDFEKLETSYMDVIRDTIETRANELYQAQETLKNTPLYPHSAAYASEHGEMAQYNASFQASHACKEAIEQAIGRHYSNNRLDAEAAVNDVLEQFGADRVQYVLANTVRHTLLAWNNRREEWFSAEFCKTPEDLRDALLDAYVNYLEYVVTDEDRDPTEQEMREIQKKRQAMFEECMKEGL